MNEEVKRITITIPIELLGKLAEIRKKEGISVSFQLSKGAELYLKEKNK